MSKEQIRQLIEKRLCEDGMFETGIKGVKLFRVTKSIPCVPAVYEPVIVAILSGSKEAIFDGKQHIYDSSKYMCCSISMPVEAGTPHASLDDPILGVYVSLDTKVMTELAIEMEAAIGGSFSKTRGSGVPQGFALGDWDDDFTEALFRLIQLGDNDQDTAILGEVRLRELYYAVLKGNVGQSVRRAFGVGNEIARTIDYLSSHLNDTITIDDMADQVGMSRAVFHRKFKQATTMSPIQFVKSMRLNKAAMKIASGMNVNQAAMNVGYVSSSQFSREFKRVYGQSPKQWVQSQSIDEAYTQNEA